MAGLFRYLLALCAALTLYACDNMGIKALKPGVSTGFEVRDRMGAPTMEWKNDDGSVVWEFARTPEGKVNYMLTIGPDNILREIRQVLSEEYFARVQKGMQRDEVRRLLGKPGRVTRLDLRRQEVWEWRYENPHNADLRFNVHFDDTGRVVDISRHEEQRGG